MKPKPFEAAWRDFQASAEPDELVAASSPAPVAAGAGILISVLLILAFVPPFAALTELRYVWYSVGLVATGGSLTLLAWTQRCRGTVGTLCTLFDNTCYSAGLALAAVNCHENVGMALSVIHGLMLVLFPARYYSLTLLFGTVMTLPVLVLLIVFQPGLPVALILLASLVFTMMFSEFTGARRKDRQRHVQLEQALGATDRLADESVQTALTTTLLTLGHFLHELRNYQTAVAVNLEYLEAASELTPEAKVALDEAQEAQRLQASLVRDTISELRGRAKTEASSFLLLETLRSIGESGHGARLRVQGSGEFVLFGNSEHLRIILLNLVRNAEQAGATLVDCDVRIGPSGASVQVTVHDDGHGLSPEAHEGLFDLFAVSTKAGGSGLGLYLVRRYAELLGGSVRADVEAAGGAAFVLSLPGRAAG